LQSEVKIIHIIVQNNTYYSARSRWTKQQHKISIIYSNIHVYISYFTPIVLPAENRKCEIKDFVLLSNSNKVNFAFATPLNVFLSIHSIYSIDVL
jgi:hypothetical protein